MDSSQSNHTTAPQLLKTRSRKKIIIWSIVGGIAALAYVCVTTFALLQIVPKDKLAANNDHMALCDFEGCEGTGFDAHHTPTDDDHDGFDDNVFTFLYENELNDYSQVAEYHNNCGTTTGTTKDFTREWALLFARKNGLTTEQLSKSIAVVDPTLAGSFDTGDTCRLLVDYEVKIDWFIARLNNRVIIPSIETKPGDISNYLNLKDPMSDDESVSTVNFNQRLAFSSIRDSLRYFATQKKLRTIDISDVGATLEKETGHPIYEINGRFERGNDEICFKGTLSLVTKAIGEYSESVCPKSGFDKFLE